MTKELIGGRYELMRGIGTGGMAVVHEARHAATGKRVALKLMRQGRDYLDATSSEKLRTRFLREMRATSPLDSPHIVSVFDAGCDEESGDLFIAMELCKGEDLKHLLERAPRLAPFVALRLVGQALVGLKEAHAVGIVHRDLKPANLFLDHGADGNVTLKVLDFGIAKFLSLRETLGPAGRTTEEGRAIGTPTYMSPEQATQNPVDARSDVWSLGIVLYKALAGMTPFGSLSMVNLICAICTEPAPPLRKLAPWVPPAIAEIVHRALAIEPADRFRDAGEMLDHVRSAAHGSLQVAVSELVLYTPSVSVPETLDVATTRIELEKGQSSRGAGLALCIVVFTHLLLLAWAATLLRHHFGFK